MEAVLVILVAFLTVVGVAYCIAKPRYAIVHVLMLFPAEQILMGYVRELRFQYGWLVNVVVGMIALSGVSYHFFKGEKVLRGSNNVVFISVVALYVWICVAILWSPSQDSAFFYLGQSWAYFMLLYLVAPLLIKSLDDLVAIIPATIVVGAILMVLMLVNPNARFIDDRFVIDLGYGVGIGEMRSNPLAIADAGGGLAIMAALYRPEKKSGMFTLIRWSAIFLGLTLALLSGSRGQVLASAALIAVLLPFVTGSRNPVRIAGNLLLVGAVIGFLFMVFQMFVASAGQDRWREGGADEGLNTRLDMALVILEGYGSSPLYWPIGLGSAAFNAFYRFRSESGHWYPHNILVEALTEYGIPGITLVCTALYCTLKRCVRMVHDAKWEPSRRSTVIVFTGLVLFQLLMSLKQGALLGMPPVFMLCIILARVAKNEETAAIEQAAVPEGDEAIESEDEEQQGEWAPRAT